MKKFLFIIPVLLLFILLIIVYFLNRPVVRDFDTCERAGFRVRLLDCAGCPKFCDTPWGVSYSKKQ